MIIEPAIDLKDGKVVRLLKGDFDTVHKVAEDPVATARHRPLPPQEPNIFIWWIWTEPSPASGSIPPS